MIIKKAIICYMAAAGMLQIAFAQEANKEKLYNPEANVIEDYTKSIMKANESGKNIMLMVGGNWCKWCYRFNDFVKKNHELDSMLNANFVTLHVNYSKENKNLPFLETLSYPQRFGFPVFVVMNGMGERLHTQSSWYLEDGKESYDAEKVKAFFKDWSTDALNPAHYEDKKK